MSLEKLTTDLNIIQSLVDEPNDVGGMTSTQAKSAFDSAGNIIKDYINNVLTPAIDLKTSPDGISLSDINAINSELANIPNLTVITERVKTVDMNTALAIRDASILANTNKLGNMGSTKIFKGSCTDVILQAKTDMLVDDYWYITDLSTNKCWNGTAWVDIGNSNSIGNNSILKNNITDKNITLDKLSDDSYLDIPHKFYNVYASVVYADFVRVFFNIENINVTSLTAKFKIIDNSNINSVFLRENASSASTTPKNISGDMEMQLDLTCASVTSNGIYLMFHVNGSSTAGFKIRDLVITANGITPLTLVNCSLSLGTGTITKSYGTQYGIVTNSKVNLTSSIKGTNQFIAFNIDGSIQNIQHKDSGNNVIRTDTFTYGTNLITEVRTLSTGEILTFINHLDTLETEVI